MVTAVREGKLVPITCPECECRLNVFKFGEDIVIAHHYTNEYDDARDARGHLCSDIGRVWTIDAHKVRHLV